MHIVCWHIGVSVLKGCPFCGAEIPEEAIYCLNCSSVLNERQSFPPVKVKIKKKKTIAVIPRKKIMGIIAIVLSVVIIFSSCLFAVKSTKDNEPSKEKPETTLAPVTKENGELVTNENGEQVFEVIEVTDTTTEKQGLLDKLFGKDESEESDKTSETTTKKQSILDKLFGDEITTASTTEPKATTSTTTTTETTTDKAGTSTTETTTKSITIPASDNESCTFEYEYYQFNSNTKYVTITKYTGNAKNVIIPSKIDGLYVYKVASYAFNNNNFIETVSLENDPTWPLFSFSSSAFYNCSKLHTINLPIINTGLDTATIEKCYNMKNISMINTNYKFEDGKLYKKGNYGWLLIYWCPATATATYTVPSWCSGIEYACNLKENSTLKTINMHKDCTMFPSGGYIHKNLENIYIDDGNPNGYDINGVAVYTGANSSTTYAVFPGSNKTKDFTIPDNAKLYVAASFYTNPYLETLRISKNAQYTNKSELFTNQIFTNLKTVYIQNGHKNEEYIKNTFKGNIYTY